MREYVVHKHGSFGVLKYEKIDDEPHPRENEVLIDQNAIGVGFNDILFRRGEYKIAKFPAILGNEACGTIVEVGAKVTEYKEGDRVAYATGPIGSCTEKRIIHKNFLITPPASLSDVEVVGCLSKGLMAHTLLHRVYDASRSKRILVHAAAGGVGQFLCSWAKHLGLEVFGTVGSENKISAAIDAGCNHVVNYQKNDFVDVISDLTKGMGVGVVYDSVGKDTILKSLHCLWPMGMCVSYGESSGKLPLIDLNHLLFNSLYITKPTLYLYKSNKIELALAANEVFTRIKKGIIKPKITSFKFSQLRMAHKFIESRESTGSVVIDLKKQ